MADEKTSGVSIDEINGPDPLQEALAAVGPTVEELVKDLEAARLKVANQLAITPGKKSDALVKLARTLDRLTDSFVGFYGLLAPSLNAEGDKEGSFSLTLNIGQGSRHKRKYTVDPDEGDDQD